MRKERGGGGPSRGEAGNNFLHESRNVLQQPRGEQHKQRGRKKEKKEGGGGETKMNPKPAGIKLPVPISEDAEREETWRELRKKERKKRKLTGGGPPLGTCPMRGGSA